MIPNTALTTPVTHKNGNGDIKYETKEDHATLDKDDFMKLFVTQLQYQDPMNPMESAEMASQVAQFNMVDLMYKNNSALEGMAKAMNTSASVSAINMLGHEVEYRGNELYVGPDGPRPFHLQIPDQGLSSCQISIKDSSGRTVKTMNIEASEPGRTIDLDWDGTDQDGNQVPEGTYHVYMEAKDLNGNDIDIETKTVGTVAGIDNSENGLPRILIKNGPVLDFNEIRNIQGS